MATSMIDSILGMVTPDMKQAIAARLGESGSSIQSGLGTATAATLGGLASRAGDSGFLSQVMGMLGSGGSQGILGNLSSLASNGPSGATGDLVSRFLPMVFGSNQNQIASAIGQRSGLSAQSAIGLLKVAAPLVLGYLGKLHSSGSLDASSLGNMLKAEAPSLQSYLPAGLLSGAAGTMSAGVGRAAAAVESGIGAATTRASRWLVPLAVLGALLLVFLLIRSTNAPKQVAQTANTAANAVSNAATTAGNAAWASLGELVAVKLPDGSALNVPSQGVETRLVTYLGDSSAPISETTWFDFDRLLFDTGTATLQPASQEQLSNIAAILKAYPAVKIRIGGYTDNTGDPAVNLKLSEERAGNVMAELTRLGVDPGRMSAKGYGAENPIADNSTEEGRQKNRRISLRVTDKGTPATT